MERKIYTSVAALSAAAAEWIAKLSKQAIQERGVFTIALSGGSTPRTLYELLAKDYRTTMDWNHTHIFWGDERFVSHDDPESNFRMVKESLLDHIEILQENIHPIPTLMANTWEAAASYASELQAFLGADIPEFDLILLGLGGDGHTASLFPGMMPDEMSDGVVIATRSPAPPAQRISLTLPVINNARSVFFLVAGEEKKEILKSVLADEGNPATNYPSARVNPRGELIWFVDEAANS